MGDRPRILVLDDNAIAVRLTMAELQGLGFDVRTATNIADFNRVFADFSPQIILTDVEMPDVTGDEICMVLRRSLDTASIPILLFSGLEEADLAQRAERAGADGYICKGAGPTSLKEKLDALMENILF